ncbi:conserved hypothetical protein [Thermobifida fusca YX]|nr:conserved hypothetical protein [Thermobifida fusca YX]
MGLTPDSQTPGRGGSVHPHVRGAHHAIAESLARTSGPSPRAWGSRAERRAGDLVQRSIPTCVGLTCPLSGAAGAVPVHPHVRGAHLSPVASVGGKRSIPTCVGLTRVSASSTTVSSVHPHVRGAHVTVGDDANIPGGPSPRAWGSRPRRA